MDLDLFGYSVLCSRSSIFDCNFTSWIVSWYYKQQHINIVTIISCLIEICKVDDTYSNNSKISTDFYGRVRALYFRRFMLSSVKGSTTSLSLQPRKYSSCLVSGTTECEQFLSVCFSQAHRVIQLDLKLRKSTYVLEITNVLLLEYLTVPFGTINFITY